MNKPVKTDQMLRLLFWEFTIKCNLSCAHCRRIDSDEDVLGDMTTEQGKVLIDQLAGIGKAQPMTPVLVFSGGEPLCRNDLFGLVEYARSSGLAVALATNGTLIDESTAGKIKNSGIARVSVSLDGATAEVHDNLRKLEGSFDDAVRGIKKLYQNDVPFQINITLTKQNAYQLEDIYQLAKSLGAVAVHIFMLVPVGCGQTLAETDMLSPDEYEKKLIEINNLDSRGELQIKVTCGPHYERVIRQSGLHKLRMTSPHQNPSNSAPGAGHGASSRGCLAGSGVIFVSHQGDVFPCGYLPVICGNVLKENLSDIWYKSKDLAKMRDSNALKGKCSRCGYKKVCHGCRARAYATTGDYMAEEPFCSYDPQKDSI